LNRILFVLAALTFAVSVGFAQNSTPAASQAAKRDPKLLTVTGCLVQGSPAGTFLLTKVPDPLVASVTAAGGGAIPTVTYQLSGGQNLGAHVGHKVEITGHGPLNEQTPVKVVDSETKYKAPGDKAPVAEVKEKAAVAVRPLTVETLKMISADCTGK
jgi:hypothetical protein